MTEEFRKFLKSLYDRLYKEGIIGKKASTSKEKVTIILDYIEKMSRVESKSQENERYLRKIKELYYKRYIIKESDIAKSYFEFLSNRYLAEGHGHLDLVNPKTNLEKETRRMHVEEIIHTEISSINAWLDYLMSSESDYIPEWAKVWAFVGMLDIGTMNKESGNFNRRSKDTIAPFVSINSEVLGKSVEYLKMYLKLIPEDYPDEETKRLASTESFYQIYGKLLAKETAIKKNGNEGIWVKYQGFNKDDALKLYESLQGYNTGWCTASSKETAINQVCGGGSYPGGDFYVYYSKDQNNEVKIPRLAIRMDKEKIGEIRGIAKNQNIEAEMEDILSLKLKEFPDSKEYKKKTSDMKELTKIYKKHQLKEELSKDELRFLYEIDNKIDGFGYQNDPRIEEIRNSRYLINDANCLFEGIEEFKGNVEFLKNLTSVKGIKFPKSIDGNLSLCGLTSAEGLVLPENIGGYLNLGLTSAKGLLLPKSIGRHLYLDGLIIAEDLILPKVIKGNLSLGSLIRAKGLVLSESISGTLNLNSLTSAEGLKLPKSIGGCLSLNSLTTADLLDVELPVVSHIIFLSSGIYNLENLKLEILSIKKARLNNLKSTLNDQKIQNLSNSITSEQDNLKRGNINIWYILIPSLTILLGILISYIIYL